MCTNDYTVNLFFLFLNLGNFRFLPMLSHIHTFPLTRRQLELLDRLQFASHQKITNPLRQRNSPPKASAAIDPEMVAELALLDDQEAPSPNTSACSFYSISSHHTEYEQQQENDGYCYDIEEDDDEGWNDSKDFSRFSCTHIPNFVFVFCHIFCHSWRYKEFL